MLYLRGRDTKCVLKCLRNDLAAEKFYKQAVASYPNFALARARLAEMQHGFTTTFITRPARLAEARRNAEEAVRLDPDCGQAHMARGVYDGKLSNSRGTGGR